MRRSRIGMAVVLFAWAGVRAAAAAPVPADPAAPTVRIEGNESVRIGKLQRVLRRLLHEDHGEMPWEAVVDDTAYAMEEWYRGRGYPLVEVDYRIDPGEPPAATFLVREGPRPMVTGIDVEGNRHLDEEEVTAFFRPPRRLLVWRPRWDYVQSEIGNDARALAGVYRSDGYLDVRIDRPDAEITEDGRSTRIRVVVDEGTRYRTGVIDITGVPDGVEAGIPARFAGPEPRPYSVAIAAEIRSALLAEIADGGYPDCRVEIEEDRHPEDGRVDLSCRVDPGPRVTITGVRVEGTRRTRADVVRRGVRLRAGEPYSRRRERETLRNLYRTGIFSNIRIDLRPPEVGEREAVICVTEAPSGEFVVEPGYGSYERLRLRVGIRERNAFGTGAAVRLNGAVSQKSLGGEIGVTRPWLFGTDVIGDLTFHGLRRQEPSFLREEFGGAALASWSVTDAFAVALSAHVRRSRANDVEAETDQDAATTDPLITSIRLAPGWDNRDNLAFPTRGHLFRIDIETATPALGGDLEYLAVEWVQSHVIDFPGDSIFAASLRTGARIPSDDTDALPIQERFFLGGENTVRSFREGMLGPRDDDGEPLGGEAYTVASAEVRAPLGGNFHAAFFVDAGNLLADHADYGNLQDIRYAVGGGLRYLLPVGPLRLDVGVNPDPEKGEPDYVVHFSVGLPY